MRVSCCLATRGDVPLGDILDSLPDWEVLIWDNDSGGDDAHVRRVSGYDCTFDSYRFETIAKVNDLGPYGRFAAIEYASGDLIYVQDDDAVVSAPQAILEVLEFCATCPGHGQMERAEIANYQGWLCQECKRFQRDEVICNMPQEFRPHYPDSAMVGFGAAFHRDTPARAFDRFFVHTGMSRDDPLFLRESCRVFTTLTPRVLVDVPKRDLPWASAPNRLWKQKDHVAMRERMLALAREVRDL